jgi:hypothetical protein
MSGIAQKLTERGVRGSLRREHRDSATATLTCYPLQPSDPTGQLMSVHEAGEGRSALILVLFQESANSVPVLKTISQGRLKRRKQFLGLLHVTPHCFQFQVRDDSTLADDMQSDNGDMLLCLRKELL